MGLLSLIVKLGADSSQYNSELNKAEVRANIFASRFQKSLKSSITKGVTIGFGISVVRSVFSDAEKLGGITDKAREQLITVRQGWELLKDGAKSAIGEAIGFAINLVDKFAGAWDAVFGLEHKDLRQTLNLGQDPTEAAESIAAMEKKLAEKKKAKDAIKELGDLVDKNNLKELNDEQKKLELTERRTAIIRLLNSGAVPKSKVLEMLQGAEELRGQIFDIKPKKDKADRFKTINFGEGSADPLAKIGGFTGRADVKILTIQERIAKATEETADNTAENTVSFR